MRNLALLYILLLLPFTTPAQDILLQGCYWSCPEDDPNEPIDSASLAYWTDRMQQQAPELAYAGFTYLWLPPLQEASPALLKPFFQALEGQGINPVASINLDRDSNLYLKARQLKTEYGISALSLHAAQTPTPSEVASAINRLNTEDMAPGLLVAELQKGATTKSIARWVSNTSQQLNFEAQLEAQPRVYDYPLREALRRASTDSLYDVRKVFDASVRDASPLSGFNVITLANHPSLKNQNGKAGDQDDPLNDPLLAYAYLLTNNQVGLPAVFYGDYYGNESEVEGYDNLPPLKEAIDQLIKTHNEFIYGATAIDYLNATGSSKKSVYLPQNGSVDSTCTLIFQIDGTSTPAGINNQPPGDKDVIVAINFSKDSLQVIQEINLANIRPDDYFTDIIGNALEVETSLSMLDSTNMERNALRIGLPARSYSIWVQGRATAVIPSRVALSARGYDQYIEVSWETAYESNLLGYELERSVNGEAFEKVTSMKAISGSSDPASYVFLDKDVFPNEKLHYRVKLLDKNGGYEYSPVEATSLFRRELSFELLDGALPYEKLLLINSNANATADINLINANGDLVMAQVTPIQSGQTRTRISMESLENGVYFLHFKIGDKRWWSKRVVKF